jgi:hypothetical protein
MNYPDNGRFMPSPSLPPELERLNRIYIETCEAFDDGEISGDEARATILGLSATDEQGRTWIVDPKKSGRRASFKQADTAPQLNDEFARMNRVYQETCAQFDSGLISATQARTKILGIVFTDETGRTWRVDTNKSGNRASFTCEPLQHNTQPIPVIEQPAQQDQNVNLLKTNNAFLAATSSVTYLPNRFFLACLVLEFSIKERRSLQALAIRTISQTLTATQATTQVVKLL